MPIYEYKCDLCNGLWEEIQKFSDDSLTVCKSCEKEGGVHKLVSGGIRFNLKGGGWYKDGYGALTDKERKKKNELYDSNKSEYEQERNYERKRPANIKLNQEIAEAYRNNEFHPEMKPNLVPLEDTSLDGTENT